ncbi:MazG-like nucleotide pyrophosphohydrolase family protein [Keratinibaculum paraultunense]|uniref:MazG-like nucleotide pyrophosphohydrolase family protein n=1 Tax=Keratinibaculum paraultunense TaxID=1278232 RepID=A0A4R3KUX4_9FIRM|nr:MazG-like family protein [Keratinibaculum paraultunense]QQY79804.1 MazG-like family protein [Keratinibaculum paraultunense]TCS88684.1 MazG-like nucleotide pyrophosphohydrolase family protein [Keratinibaculum paraultunense]
MKDKNNVDIIKNLRTIEWLKSEILTSVANLYEILATGEENTKEDIEDLLSNIILLSYLLGKRLGLDYDDINLNLRNKIKLNIIKDHQIEKWYGDLSQLLELLNT